MTKKTYEAPAVAVLGSFEEITRATNNGPNLDQTFPTNTPLVDILDHGLS